MEIVEAKERRTKLAMEIAESINAFQNETGLTVREVNLRHLLTVTSGIPVKTQVEIKTELP